MRRPREKTLGTGAKKIASFVLAENNSRMLNAIITPLASLLIKRNAFERLKHVGNSAQRYYPRRKKCAFRDDYGITRTGMSGVERALFRHSIRCTRSRRVRAEERVREHEDARFNENNPSL